MTPRLKPGLPICLNREPYQNARTQWSRRSGLNGRPAVYETAALPTELRRLSRETTQLTRVFSQPQGVFRPITDNRDQQPPGFIALACHTNRRGHGPLLKLGNRLQPDYGPLAWPGETEGLLLVSILLTGHLGHLPLRVGAQFAGQNGAVFVEICGAAQASE